MNQMTKSLCFVGAAVGAVVLAYAGRPASVQRDAAATTGVAELAREFNEPLMAKSLKIVRFDEALASVSQIEVKESGGIWTLPSHDGYPADAENRIRDATTQFIGLESMSVVSDSDGDHSLYGVLEPGAGKSAVGDQGVGTRVTVEGDGGKKLVDLIVGKELKDTPELHYVRQPGRSRVYVAKLDPKNLPVRFDDWIEKDLLGLESWDIQQLVLKDYSFQVAATLSGAVTDYDQRLEMTVTDDNGNWTLDELLVSNNDQLQPTELQENEELNSERLNALKDALDGLEIVNVERKPASLGADLRADNGFANDRAGIQSLLERGFYPVEMPPDGRIEVLSADGEVLVRTKLGVEYVLRFGGVEGVDTESDEGKLNRFLLVTARVNDAHFPDPELNALPETVDDLQPPADSETDNLDPQVPDAEDSGTGAEPESESQPESESTTETDVPAADGDETSSHRAPRTPTDSQTQLAATLQDEPNEPADVGQDDTATEDNAAADASESTDAEDPAPDAPEAPVASQDASDTPVDLEAKLKEERERITKENQRKIDERNDKLDKARDKVRELNFRFADWYYVISEDVYKKIHLSHTDIIQESSADDDSDATRDDVPSFNPQGLPGLPDRPDRPANP
jgi:hypothetical protein